MISIFIVYEKLQRSKWCNRQLITHRIPPAVSGPDGRIPPAPGTNQIAGFVEYRPFAHWEKNKNSYFCRTIKDWNALPSEIVNIKSADHFKKVWLDCRIPSPLNIQVEPLLLQSSSPPVLQSCSHTWELINECMARSKNMRVDCRTAGLKDRQLY